MKKTFLIPLALFTWISSYSQQSYGDSMKSYIDGYVKDHDIIVKPEDKKQIQFFPVDKHYCVTAKFEKTGDGKWFLMETSGQEKKLYRVYGTVTFPINDTVVKLNLYQSQSLMEDPEYKDYLLLLFTDRTSGVETYESGRYLDFTIDDLKNNELMIDFNKAYNPYCAYENGYNCPLPPKENNLMVSIKAGEKSYPKKLK